MGLTGFDWKLYNGNLTWLPERTIFMARHGSKAYGTSLPTSDEDFRTASRRRCPLTRAPAGTTTPRSTSRATSASWAASA